MGPPVLVIAHRGSSAQAPENTLAAIELAARQGADLCEVDVRRASDDALVLLHDEDLLRTAGRPGRAAAMTGAALAAVDVGSTFGPAWAGERVPRVEAALELAASRGLGLELEVKPDDRDPALLAARLAALIAAGPRVHPLFVTSSDEAFLRTLHGQRPDLPLGLVRTRARGWPWSLAHDVCAVKTRVATEAFVQRAHRAGRAVHVWTVDRPATMRRLVARGVDGIITNRPRRAREVVDAATT